MSRRIKLRKIPAFLILLIIFVVAFSHGYFFTEKASAPFIGDGMAVTASRNAPVQPTIDNTEPPPTNPEDLIPDPELSPPDTPGAPDTPDTPGSPGSPGSSSSPGAPGSPGSPGAPEPAILADEFILDEYVTVRMSVSDISKGSLILINHDYSYEIQGFDGFVAISDEKTASYRVSSGNVMISGIVIAPLNEMMDAFYAETGNNTVTINNAFRDYQRQLEIHNEYIRLVGRAEAQKWASPPGHSEHHAALAVDFGVYSGGEIRAFSGTGVFSWFKQNSYKYGFILRFPSDKTEITKIAYEPWHYRYVGKLHAYLMHENNLCLEEYIELVMGYTFDEPFIADYEGEEYMIYYSDDISVPVPFDCEFDVSGNNIDGFIVTAKFSD